MCKIDASSQLCIIDHGHISMIDLVWEQWEFNHDLQRPRLAVYQTNLLFQNKLN